MIASIEAAIREPERFGGLDRHRRRYLIVGGFPELLTLEPNADEPSEILRSQRVLRADAVQTALYKDVQQAFGVGEPVKLERLLYVLAGQAWNHLADQAGS